MTVQVTRLPSGLTVATDAMPGTATVSLGAWIGAGTRHGTPEVNGIAHLLEHMVFKGTERRSAQDIAEEIEAVRSEERRVGKECVSPCRSRWSPERAKKKIQSYRKK